MISEEMSVIVDLAVSAEDEDFYEAVPEDEENRASRNRNYHHHHSPSLSGVRGSQPYSYYGWMSTEEREVMGRKCRNRF